MTEGRKATARHAPLATRNPQPATRIPQPTPVAHGLFQVAGTVLALPAAALTRILLDEFYLCRTYRADARAIDQQATRIVTGEETSVS